MTVTVLFPQARPVGPGPSITWRDRPGPARAMDNSNPRVGADRRKKNAPNDIRHCVCVVIYLWCLVQLHWVLFIRNFSDIDWVYTVTVLVPFLGRCASGLDPNFWFLVSSRLFCTVIRGDIDVFNGRRVCWPIADHFSWKNSASVTMTALSCKYLI